MSRSCVPFALLLGIVIAVPRTPDTRLECTADTNLSSYETERELNYGASARIRLKGIQMLGLFRFDVAPLAGKVVEAATLHLRYAGSDRRLRTIGLSTLAEPWDEGDGRGDRRPGQACFVGARLGARAWAPDATDFAEVVFRDPGVRGYADVKDDSAGWFNVEVAPTAVQAMVAGLATGLVVTDEKGQTGANNDVYSREQHGSEPYLTVRAEPYAPVQPEPVSGLRASPEPAAADFETGALRVAFDIPAGAIGVTGTLRTSGTAETAAIPHRVLSLHGPGAHSVVLRGLSPGRVVSVMLQSVAPTGLRSRPVECRAAASRAVVRPRALNLLRKSVHFTRPPLFRTGNVMVAVGPLSGRGAAGDGGDPSQPANGRWDGAAVALTAARGETASFTLTLRSGNRAVVQVSPRFPVPTRMYRLALIKDGQWVPEACVPSDGALTFPGAASDDPGSGTASVLVEVPIPVDARAGLLSGTVRVAETGSTSAVVPIRVRVARWALPDARGFDISLNTYGSPARASGVPPDSGVGVALEHAYHRLAHEHRCTLAPLGYSHSGNIEPGYAPTTAGTGASRLISDWTQWDARFGGLLDGKAFATRGRPGRPISHLYLPFHEAWPEDIRTEYSYTPGTRAYPEIIAEHAQRARPIDESLSTGYRAGIEAVVRDFDRHLRARAWDRTRFHFYLNNKYYYRDPATGGRGTSWWLLDEPMHRDDWLALAWFARAMRAALAGSGQRRMLFRADISRPQWQRDYLDGLVDLMVVNDELYARKSLMRRFREEGGVRLWHYGSAPAIRAPLAECEAWPVRAYLAGADGIVPWQSVGRRDNYHSPEPTALILPHPTEPAGVPVATLRLKALSRGQITVEYLRGLAALRGWSREQVAEAVAPFWRSRDLAGMRLAVLQALGESGTARSHARQRSGQRPTGLPRRPSPKP